MPGPTDKPALELQDGAYTPSESLPKPSGGRHRRHPTTKRKRTVRTNAAKIPLAQGTMDTLTALKKDGEITEASRSISGAELKLSDVDTQNYAPRGKEIKRYNVREKLRGKLDGLHELKGASSPTDCSNTKDSVRKDLIPEDSRSNTKNSMGKEPQIPSLANRHSEEQQPRSSDAQKGPLPTNHKNGEELAGNVRGLAQTTAPVHVQQLAGSEPSAATYQRSTLKKNIQLFTLNGKIVSKARWRRLKAMARAENANVNECDDILALGLTSVDPSEQQSSYFSSINNHQNPSGHLLTSSHHHKDTSVLSNREQHDDNMSTKGGSVRGKAIPI